MFNISRIMIEAHAAAKADYDFVKSQPGTYYVSQAAKGYRHFLGLAMRNYYADARVVLTGMVPSTPFADARWY